MSKGVIYIASGESYIRKATISAESLRTHNPDLPITLLTDESVESPAFNEIVNIDVDIAEKGDSILSRDHMRYDKTLFLDADTFVATDISDMFIALDRFDIVAAHNEARAWYHEEIYEQAGVNLPECFPEYNSGVVGYNDNRKVRQLFDRWNEAYTELGYERNQPAFRIALYDSDVNIGTLPPEYNFMTHTIGFASGEVKILHQGASDEELAEWASLLNDVDGKKVTTWEAQPCRVVPNSYKNRKYRLQTADWNSVTSLFRDARAKQQRDGTLSLLSAGVRRMKSFALNDETA